MSSTLAELVRLLPAPAAPVPALPTGITPLDAVLNGGGIPRGRLTEIVGPVGSGKTTLARALVEATLAEWGWVAYVDAQRSLDPRDWTHLGDDEGVWIIRPHEAGRAAWCADVLLRSGAFALVLLDGAPLLTRTSAVRLTRLARDANAALVVLGERAGGATQLGGATRLVVERPPPRTGEGGKRRGAGDDAGGGRGGGGGREGATRTIAVRVEKGGTLRTVEVSCAVAVARRLCTHPEVPDRRGVARGAAGGGRHGRGGRPAAPSSHAVRGDAAARALSAERSVALRTAVARARALG